MSKSPACGVNLFWSVFLHNTSLPLMLYAERVGLRRALLARAAKADLTLALPAGARPQNRMFGGAMAHFVRALNTELTKCPTATMDTMKPKSTIVNIAFQYDLEMSA